MLSFPLFLKVWAFYTVLVGSVLFFNTNLSLSLVDLVKKVFFARLLAILFYAILALLVFLEMLGRFHILHILAFLDTFGALYIILFRKSDLDLFKEYFKSSFVRYYGMLITLIGVLILFLI